MSSKLLGGAYLHCLAGDLSSPRGSGKPVNLYNVQFVFLVRVGVMFPQLSISYVDTRSPASLLNRRWEIEPHVGWRGNGFRQRTGPPMGQRQPSIIL